MKWNVDWDLYYQREQALFERICRKHFQFLIDDFGCKVVDTGKGPLGGPNHADIHVTYQNATTGVSMGTGGYGWYMGVALIRFINGESPFTSFDPNQSTARIPRISFGLDSVIRRRNPSLLPKRVGLGVDWDHWRKKMGVTEEEVVEIVLKRKEAKFERALSKYAHALRECAADVLRGDFEFFDELWSSFRKFMEDYQNMSPEEKQAWTSLSDEQRSAWTRERKERWLEEWRKMLPEQKTAWMIEHNPA